VSGRHFRQADLDDRLLQLMRAHNVNPRSLRIEVTERTLLENPAQVKRMLDNLREHGVRIALDDFGTGYSSLSYLHQYPIETLKIDRSFITELAKANSHAVPVVRAIQVLADSLQMQVIAEGIEEEAQRQVLRHIGCRFGQGFLFAHPQPVEVWLK
jgi:EAL domain-containing protein (putative c-di-GMP-specific phosphodiesterase class I)